MKRTLHLALILFLVAALNFSFAQTAVKPTTRPSELLAAQQQKPKIVFEKLEHNFGAFKEAEGVQTTTFKFTNKGSVPLVLSNVKTSCGCTATKYTREPVAPNATGEVQVSFDPQNRPGTINKTITVSSNAENPTVVLRISGSVEQREKTLAELYPREIGSLRAQTNYISFAQIKINAVETKDLELLNETEKPIKIGFKSVPKHLTAKIVPETIPAHGKGVLSVTYNAMEAKTYGFDSQRIYLTENGSNDYKNSIGISATIEEDFSSLTPEQLTKAPAATFAEKDFDFGDMVQGEKEEHTFSLTNSGKTDLIIRNVRSSCGCTAVAPSKSVITPGETAPIKVTFDSTGKRGRQSKTITVITNDPKNPTTTLRISCNINTPS